MSTTTQVTQGKPTQFRPKSRLGEEFVINGHRCRVIKEDSFGGEPHFGFVAVEDAAIIGWVPVRFVGAS